MVTYDCSNFMHTTSMNFYIELICYLCNTYKTIDGRSSGLVFTARWVAGHSKVKGKEVTEELATSGSDTPVLRTEYRFKVLPYYFKKPTIS